MRVLKRAGSDTELDVEGVKTHAVDSPERLLRQTDEWVKGHAMSRVAMAGIDLPETSGARRITPQRDNESPMFPAVFPRSTGASGAVQNATHRRGFSDGAVLVADMYERLDRQDDGGYGEHSSSEDEIER